MKFNSLIAIALLACSVQAHAALSCEELKSKVTTKLDGKNVKGYTLDVVANDKVGDAKVVGSCDGGTKKLTYVRK
jgi:hypothetical protein